MLQGDTLYIPLCNYKHMGLSRKQRHRAKRLWLPSAIESHDLSLDVGSLLQCHSSVSIYLYIYLPCYPSLS